MYKTKNFGGKMKITIVFNDGSEKFIINAPYSVSDAAIKNKVFSLYPKNTVKEIYRERYGFLTLVK